jgi:hypothetical protein
MHGATPSILGPWRREGAQDVMECAKFMGHWPPSMRHAPMAHGARSLGCNDMRQMHGETHTIWEAYTKCMGNFPPSMRHMPCMAQGGSLGCDGMLYYIFVIVSSMCGCYPPQLAHSLNTFIALISLSSFLGHKKHDECVPVTLVLL